MSTSPALAARLSLPLLVWSAGCAVDFGLQTATPPSLPGADSGLPTDAGDSAVDADSAAPVGDDDPPARDEEEEETETVVDDPPPEDDCTETSELIYVVERAEQTLYLFDPSTLAFTRLGRLSCPSGAYSPGSMAVSRSGVAYVRYSNESLYAVDLTDLSCERTPYRSPSGFGSFGMGYATDDDSAWRDRLYLADEDSVGHLDTDTWTLDVLGDMGSQSELTGNSDGELWAFLPLESPPALVQVDKSTGAERARIRLTGMPDVGDIDTFAFAAWGGEHWLFIRSYGMGSSTNVYRVGADGRLALQKENVGFDVVGAGVSTCAPAE